MALETHLCAGCHQQVVVCSCCDRGQIYCADGFARQARRRSVHQAGRRYQASRRGRRMLDCPEVGGSHRFANDRLSLEARSNSTGPLQRPPRTNEPQPATTGSVISLPPLSPQSLDSPLVVVAYMYMNQRRAGFVGRMSAFDLLRHRHRQGGIIALARHRPVMATLTMHGWVIVRESVHWAGSDRSGQQLCASRCRSVQLSVDG